MLDATSLNYFNKLLFMCIVDDVNIKEDTVLEVDVKGSCIPYDLVIEPNAFIIPGQILQDTVIKKKFKVCLVPFNYCSRE